MTAKERRSKIKDIILATSKPISATALANLMGVSRQVIVGDVAIMRASGEDIIATARGYLPAADSAGIKRVIACNHSCADTQKELYIMVDAGCTVVDVVVEHPVYGQIAGQLGLASRLDVDQFMDRISDPGAQPLSTLTEGIHLHTVTCPDTRCLDHLLSELSKAGILISE